MSEDEGLDHQIVEATIECERLRQLAHDAPFAEWSKDHRGHSAIVNHTSAWADRGNEWLKACAKRDALIEKRNARP